MKKMNCKDIQRKLSQYIDNRISAKERSTIETHIKKCVFCAAEKEKLDKVTTVFRSIPEFLPAQDSEEVFWKKVQQARRHLFIEKIRSFFSQWNFIPVYYPATALFLIGLVLGICLGPVYNGTFYKNKFSSSKITYLALDRMDTIPYRSFSGVYLTGSATPHKLSVEGH
jgi:hypothetical protein